MGTKTLAGGFMWDSLRDREPKRRNRAGQAGRDKALEMFCCGIRKRFSRMSLLTEIPAAHFRKAVIGARSVPAGKFLYRSCTFQQMIDEYNAGSINVEEFFNQLLKFAQDLIEEEKRGISENLTEEELALFDLLTKPDPKLTKSEQAKVKKIAHELFETLKREKLVLTNESGLNRPMILKSGTSHRFPISGSYAFMQASTK
jgi:hypothetical protein